MTQPARSGQRQASLLLDEAIQLDEGQLELGGQRAADGGALGEKRDHAVGAQAGEEQERDLLEEKRDRHAGAGGAAEGQTICDQYLMGAQHPSRCR